MGNHTSKTKRGKFSCQKFMYNDKKAFEEQEHLCHSLIREAFKGNFSSPIRDILSDKNSKILDVGCGSGFWSIEMAADFPEPNYIGIDILPTFPKSTFPSNIQFLKHNFLDGLPYKDNTFDFVHMRRLAYNITELQWETFVFKELARVLKPGGWLEISDPEFGLIKGGPIVNQLNLAMYNELLSSNIDPFISERYHSLIKAIPSLSLTILHYERRSLPLYSNGNNKMGELGGTFVKEFCRSVLQGPVGKNMNVKKRDINPILDKVGNEFESYQTYFNIHRFYVQKF